MRKLEIDEVRRVIQDSSPETSIYMGCDSQRYWSNKENRMMISFVRTVVIHIDSSAGCMVYGDKKLEPDYTGSVRYRMMLEVFSITELAQELVDAVGDRHFEIHLDINPSDKHKSNAAMKEAMGYVKGVLGIDAKIKPDAPAASVAADRYC